MSVNLQPVDVICQHFREGKITPIKIRVVDEDGVFQEYKIKGYRDLSGHGARTMPDGVYVNNSTLVYECNITLFGRNRTIRLYYDPPGMKWRINA